MLMARGAPIFLLMTLILSGISFDAHTQTIAYLRVKAVGYSRSATPVRVDLDGITHLPDSLIRLEEVKGRQRLPVAYQLSQGGGRQLQWILSGTTPAGQVRTFALVKGRPAAGDEKMEAVMQNGTWVVRSGARELMAYQYQTVYPPQGIDSAYKRNGFIHPLRTPHGQVLTRIQPPDHYHHMGIWNPWTHLLFEKDTIDCWNLKEKLGTVRFAGFLSVTAGPVYAAAKVLHEHVVLKYAPREKTALHEVQEIKVFRPSTENDFYILDITSTLNCATENPVKLLQYRYGGLGWRATEQWNRNNSQVFTSEGKTRKEADGSRARWCVVQGDLNGETGGVVFMSFPTNYNYPEPLRVWPEDMNKRGDVFVNFSPTKDRDWLLTKGNEYVLHYRLLVFNGNMTQEKAEQAWQDFAHPPVVEVKMAAASN